MGEPIILNFAETKAYLKVDTDFDDELIALEILAAEEYLKNATGQSYTPEDILAKLYCLMLVQQLYDNRTLVVTGAETLSATASAIMLQLSLKVDETL